MDLPVRPSSKGGYMSNCPDKALQQSGHPSRESYRLVKQIFYSLTLAEENGLWNDSLFSVLFN
jgi:hypothetical protein